jgi:biotin-(acetyl-CoA carboxylase) ligase
MRPALQEECVQVGFSKCGAGDLRDFARSAAKAHRSIFVSDYQRAGRGRQGRAWVATAGVALLLS